MMLAVALLAALALLVALPLAVAVAVAVGWRAGLDAAALALEAVRRQVARGAADSDLLAPEAVARCQAAVDRLRGTAPPGRPSRPGRARGRT